VVEEVEDSFSNVVSTDCLQKDRYSPSNRKLQNQHSNSKTAAVEAKEPTVHVVEEEESRAYNDEKRHSTM
jgi:hypothetical protein